MFGIPIPTLVTIMAAGGAILTVIAIAIPFLSGGGKAGRMKMMTRTRQQLARAQMDDLAVPSGSSLRNRGGNKDRVEMMKKILAALKLDEALSSKKLRGRLAQAGYRSQNALVAFLFIRTLTTLGVPLLGFFFLTVTKENYPLPTKALIIAGAAAVGFYLPAIIMSNKAQKRQKDLNLGFADALDLMVICVEGGLSVEGAFDKVTNEINDNFPTLAQEFGITSAELAYLGDRHKAYENFAERTGLPAVKSLATTLIQSEKYGTPVGQALKILSKERREDRMAMAEKKGASLPAKLTVPMILFFLPPLFLVVIGPAAIQMGR